MLLLLPLAALAGNPDSLYWLAPMALLAAAAPPEPQAQGFEYIQALACKSHTRPLLQVGISVRRLRGRNRLTPGDSKLSMDYHPLAGWNIYLTRFLPRM